METPPRKKSAARRIFYLVVVPLALLLLAAIAIPNYVKARATPCKNACINNLRQIDGAKEQWALEKKLSAGTPAIDSEIDEYIKGGSPKCPGGGNYKYNPVDASPTCDFKTNRVEVHSL